jgi:hypothetical protein
LRRFLEKKFAKGRAGARVCHGGPAGTSRGLEISFEIQNETLMNEKHSKFARAVARISPRRIHKDVSQDEFQSNLADKQGALEIRGDKASCDTLTLILTTPTRQQRERFCRGSDVNPVSKNEGNCADGPSLLSFAIFLVQHHE